MKVLVLSCNTGEGHNSAGRAIFEKLLQNGIEAEFADTLSIGSQNASLHVNRLYTNITTKTPSTFKLLYKAGSAVSRLKIKSPVYAVNKLNAKSIYTYILRNNFHAVITSHLFPAETLTSIRKQRGKTFKFLSVATDYTCIPFWEETQPDYFIIPHSELLKEFTEKGIPKEKLLPYGIPVSDTYKTHTEKSCARRELSLDEEKTTLLLMSGSMGFGKPEALIQALCQKFGENTNLVALCGNNKKLENRLRTQFGSYKNVIVRGYTNQVSLYMDACDLLFTKPGGLTSTEAAVKNIPIIHTAPIPGCETKNAQFFAQRYLSVYSPGDPQKAACDAFILLHDPQKKEKMLEMQNRYIYKDAADSIYKLLLEICG